MIRIESDENVHEADYELVLRFAEALLDKDKEAMQEVLFGRRGPKSGAGSRR